MKQASELGAGSKCGLLIESFDLILAICKLKMALAPALQRADSRPRAHVEEDCIGTRTHVFIKGSSYKRP